jgi:hypothetical protein
VRSEARKAIISATSSVDQGARSSSPANGIPPAPGHDIQPIRGGNDDRDGVSISASFVDVGRNREHLAACSLCPPPPYGQGCCRDRTTLWSQAHGVKRLLCNEAKYMSGKQFVIAESQLLVDCVDVEQAVGETGEREL